MKHSQLIRTWWITGITILGTVLTASACEDPSVSSPPSVSPSQSSPAAPTPTVSQILTITDPDDGAKVAHRQTVKGAVRGLPSDTTLWVLLKPEGTERLYPQSGPALILGEEWSVECQFGQPDSSGVGFTIILVTASPASHTVFDNYLKQARQSGDFSGLQPPLPDGAKGVADIEVTR